MKRNYIENFVVNLTLHEHRMHGSPPGAKVSPSWKTLPPNEQPVTENFIS